MESWEVVVVNYSRDVDVCALGKMVRTAQAVLQSNLTKIEAERIATTFLFHPISALDLVRLLEEDSVWNKPLCDIYNVITTLIDKYPDSVSNYHDLIIVACSVPVTGRAAGAASRCLRALSALTARAAVPGDVTALLRTQSTARAERALLLGTLCELYPETVTDVEEVCGALLALLAANNYSESVYSAALRGMSCALRHLAADVPGAVLTQVHRHLARHIYCKECREVVLDTVEQHATVLGPHAARSSVLRVRLWTRPHTAAMLYCAALPHLTQHLAQKIVTEEVLPRLKSPRAGVRGAARNILKAAGHNVPHGQVPGTQLEEDVYGLRLRLLADCHVDYELADEMYWCIKNKVEDSARLLEACVCAHERLPRIQRNNLLARAFYKTPAIYVQRHVDTIIRKNRNDPTALQHFTSLCNELFNGNMKITEHGSQSMGRGQLLHLFLNRMIGELESCAGFLPDDIDSYAPAKLILSQICALVSVAKDARLSIASGVITRLKTAAASVGLRCGTAEDAREDLHVLLDEVSVTDGHVECMEVEGGSQEGRGAGDAATVTSAVTSHTIEDKAELLADCSAHSDELVASVVCELSASLGARLEECSSRQAARALLALLRAAAGAAPPLVQLLVGIAAGPSQPGWWDSALAQGVRDAVRGAKGTIFLREVCALSLLHVNPLAAFQRLLLPAIRHATEATRAQFLSEVLRSLVSALRGAKHAKNFSKGLFALRLILLMMETVPKQRLCSQSWLELREVCVLGVALRKLHQHTEHSLEIHQCSYKVLCACVRARCSGVRACACAHGAHVWDNIVGPELPSLSLPANIYQVIRKQGAFLSELTEDSHQYDLFGDGPFLVQSTEALTSEPASPWHQRMQSTEALTSEPASPWHPCIEAISSLLQHLVTITHVEDSPAWASDLRQSLASARVPVRWLLAQAVCQTRVALLPYASYLAASLMNIVADSEQLNSLHLDIIDTLVSWGLSETTALSWDIEHESLSRCVMKAVQAGLGSCTVLPRLAALLAVCPMLATEELIGPLLQDENTRYETCRVLCSVNICVPCLLPSLLDALLAASSEQRRVIVELVARSLASRAADTALHETLRRLRRDSGRDCLYVLSRLSPDHVASVMYRWSTSVRGQLSASGIRALSAATDFLQS